MRLRGCGRKKRILRTKLTMWQNHNNIDDGFVEEKVTNEQCKRKDFEENYNRNDNEGNDNRDDDETKMSTWMNN